MSTFFQDLKFGARLLAKDRSFTATAQWIDTALVGRRVPASRINPIVVLGK